MAQDARSNGEGPNDLLDWHRRFCKAQRQRLQYRLTRMAHRIQAEREASVEEWERSRPASGKKPGLDYYDARWR